MSLFDPQLIYTRKPYYDKKGCINQKKVPGLSPPQNNPVLESQIPRSIGVLKTFGYKVYPPNTNFTTTYFDFQTITGYQSYDFQYVSRGYVTVNNILGLIGNQFNHLYQKIDKITNVNLSVGLTMGELYFQSTSQQSTAIVNTTKLVNKSLNVFNPSSATYCGAILYPKSNTYCHYIEWRGGQYGNKFQEQYSNYSQPSYISYWSSNDLNQFRELAENGQISDDMRILDFSVSTGGIYNITMNYVIICNISYRDEVDLVN